MDKKLIMTLGVAAVGVALAYWLKSVYAKGVLNAKIAGIEQAVRAQYNSRGDVTIANLSDPTDPVYQR